MATDPVADVGFWPLALPTRGYPIGTLLRRATRATFFIGMIDSMPTLMLDPDAEGPAIAEAYAEGVENFGDSP